MNDVAVGHSTTTAESEFQVVVVVGNIAVEIFMLVLRERSVAFFRMVGPRRPSESVTWVYMYLS